MRPTPFGPLFWRALRGHCPICARGPLYQGFAAMRSYCPLCGFRYQRAVEYGPGGYLSGAITLNVIITGAVPLAMLVYIAATGLTVAVPVQLAAAIIWALIFPILFHRIACALWLAIDLRLNPPAPHELIVSPPPARPDSPGEQGG